MKQYWTILICLLTSLFFSPTVFSVGNEIGKENSSITQLKKMREVMLTQDYQLSFVYIDHNSDEPIVESFRYGNAIINDQHYAQLLPLDGPVREVILRDSTISYFFQVGSRAFSIKGEHIIDDVLPSIIFADIDDLKSNYNMVHIGQARIADRICNVIRISPKDGFRYSYEVWLDENSFLPMQIELHDTNGEALQQVRVLSVVEGAQAKELMLQLVNIAYPPELSITDKKATLDWSLNWLPNGFKEISSNRKSFPGIDEVVETKLYSDGLFNFSVNIFSQSGSTPFSLNSSRSFYSENIGNREVMIVGELPLTTIQRIAKDISFKNQ